MDILVALHFLKGDFQKRGLSFSWGRCDLHRNYVRVVILLSFLCDYDNLTLKLHQEKRSCSDEGRRFTDSKFGVH